MPRRRRNRWILAVLGGLLWLLLARSAHAGNPDLRWRTLETEHFYIHYPAGQEAFAARVALTAERAYANLSQAWSHEVFLKIHVSVTDGTDLANGSATAVPFARVSLNVTAPEALSVLENYDDWIDILVTHEMVHIVHLDTVHGLPRLLNALLGFGVLGKTVSPNVAQPRWFVEGIATYEESAQSTAGRGRSALFDMYLRMAVLEGTFQTLDQASNGARIWPHGSTVYLYGLHFMRYIAERYGHDKLTELSHIYGGQVIPLGINRALRKVLGVDYHRLWADFKADRERHYRAEARRIRARGLRDGRRLTFSGEITRYPIWSPDGTALYYYGDNGHARGGIRRVSRRGARVREGVGVGREGTSMDEKLFVQLTDPTSVGFARGGRTFILDRTSVHDMRYAWSDLYAWTPGSDPRDLRQLTFGRRASEPHVAPDGRTVVFRRNDAAQSRLGFLDLDTGAVEEVRAPERVTQVYTPRFSPDGTQVAYSAWRPGGYRDIYVYDRKARTHRAITSDRFADLSPTWSPDGRYIVFTSDRTGVQNIHAYDTEDGSVHQVSNVLGGAFEPTVSPTGDAVAYVGFTSEGYDLWLLPFDPDLWLPALPAGDVVPAPHDERPARNITRRARRYRPGRTMYPRTLFPTALDVQASSFATEVGLELGVSDVLGFHSLLGRFAYLMPPFNQPVGSLQYTFNRLLPVFSLGVSRGFAVRNGFTRYVYDYDQLVSQEDGGSYELSGYREVIWSANGSMNVPVIRDARYNVSAAVGYRFTNYRNLDEGAGNGDPNAPLPRLPETGNVAQVNLDLVYDSQYGAKFGYGAVAGTRVAVGVAVLDPALGGDYGDIQGRASVEQNVQMPWRGHQVLALRASGGASAGGLRRRGAFFVGGLPEEQDVFRSLLARTPVSTAGVIRGYRRGQFGGRYFFVTNAEYRIPVADVDRGLGTLPAMLRRVTLIPYVDAGMAWTNPLTFKDVAWGLGTSLVFTFRLGYLESVSLFFDYAHGFQDETGLDVFRLLVARSF